MECDLLQEDFMREWRLAEPAVRRYCMRSLRDRDAADDAVQETRIRAWRGYPTFQRRGAFLAWALKIAQHEVIREIRRNQRYVDMDEAPEPATPAVEQAIQGQVISPTEASVVRCRLANSEAKWPAIGAIVGVSANNCAVLYLRAMQKLRVYLFQHYPDVLGGSASIRLAYEAALVAAPVRQLKPNEAAAFRQYVLQGRDDPKRGQSEDLRSACMKVALQLEPPEPS
jgi:RNA polymerase sigma factor (sigma-70 family)